MRHGPLRLFLNHVDECPNCCWVTRSFCRTADLLLANDAQRAAALMVPIPSIQRSKVKA